MTLGVRIESAGTPKRARRGVRALLWGCAALGALGVFILFAYELALARVPQHRAALEQFVRAETGLDLSFGELGLRWGWYGPEAVFRRVELGEPGRPEAVLRAPELIVGLDAWRTLRSGRPEAGRIELIAPDIDLTNIRPTARVEVPGALAAGEPAPDATAWSTEGVQLLRRWRGGRIEIEGGSLRLADPTGATDPLTIQIRRASIRRADAAWTIYALVFLPERLGRTARLVMHLDGSPGNSDLFSGRVHVDARRLQFSGWNSVLQNRTALADVLPRAGSGDATVELNFRRGRIVRAGGTVRAAGLVFAPPQLGGAELHGNSRNLTFDWDAARQSGDRLHASARFEDVVLAPRSHDFTLSGLSLRVSGTEQDMTVELQSDSASLVLSRSRRYPLAAIRIASTLQIHGDEPGWRITTERLLLEHGPARLMLHGDLRADSSSSARNVGSSGDARINLGGTLTGADIPLVERILGDSTAQAFGAAASRLTAGEIQNAQFELRGPVSELPFGSHDEAFTGSLALRNAVLSGGDFWPDAADVTARVEWHGAHIKASVESGRAGAFQLRTARAEWDAGGGGNTHLAGLITGRIEDALTWLRSHPALRDYAPDVQDVAASGAATFDFSVAIPTGVAPSRTVEARISTTVDGAQLEAVAGLPPMQSLSGTFVFDAGHLQPSTLTGLWLGGPVVLRLGEHRERGARTFAIQAQGTLNGQQVAALANAPRTVQGTADWSGELSFAGSHWRMRADSSLMGIASLLPDPFAKHPGAAVPVHIELAGADDRAQVRIALADRLRSAFALQRRAELGWIIERGSVRLGTAAAPLPEESLVLLQGRINRLDLPAWVLALQQLQRNRLPPLRARIAADELLVAGRAFQEVSLQAQRTDTRAEVGINSAALRGVIRWSETSATDVHLTRLDVPVAREPGGDGALIAALAPAARVLVDEVIWDGHPVGRLTGNLAARGDLLVLDELQLVNESHDARGKIQCQIGAPACRLNFRLDSRDVAATLTAFGIKPELTGSQAALSGEVQWRPDAQLPWLASLSGALSLRMENGSTRLAPLSPDAQPFALVPLGALFAGLDDTAINGAGDGGLHFARLDADFELHDGQATTSDLNFDGDAEILIRGRTGLVSRDYDLQAWILRGEDRLPAAVRRFGATPRVAALWLALRGLFTGDDPERYRAVLRLRGPWEDPVVAAAN